MPIGYGIQTDPPPIAPIPWTDAAEIARSPFGVALEVGTDCCSDIRGIGCQVPVDGSLFDKRITHCYVGAKLVSSDTEISRCRLFNHRDACLWIAANAGNCQSLNNHCYGARIACYNEGGGPFRATNDTYADSLIGYFGDVQGGGSNQTTLTNVLFQHNSVADCIFRATGGRLVGCTVDVQRATKEHNELDIQGFPPYTGKLGVVLGYRCSIQGGCVALSPFIHPANTPSGKGATGIAVTGDNCRVETDLIDWDGIGGATGIKVFEVRRNIFIDCNVEGFHEPTDRVLVAYEKVTALDVTLRMELKKPLNQYISLAAGWTGSVRIIDTATGKSQALPVGRAV